MEDRKLITMKDGKRVEYDIIIQFTSSKKNKNYVGYTDYSKDSNGNSIVYVSTYEKDPKDENLYILSEIKNQDEIEAIKQMINDLK